MSTRSFLIPEQLASYVDSTWTGEPEVLRELREETAGMPHSNMQISADQGRFMSVLVKGIAARKTLEVGVFTGYSSTVTALSLPADGQLVACDVSEEYTSVARRYWEKAGVAHKITLRLGPATDTLDALLATGQAGTFDFAFIDADKPNYAAYWDKALQLLRPGGLVAVDNVLWSGKVADETDQTESTIAIREFNRIVTGDSRVQACLVPIGDGLTLAYKL